MLGKEQGWKIPGLAAAWVADPVNHEQFILDLILIASNLSPRSFPDSHLEFTLGNEQLVCHICEWWSLMSARLGILLVLLIHYIIIGWGKKGIFLWASFFTCEIK